MLLEDIIWHRHPTLCSVSHRGSQSRYHINSTFFNKARTSLPICVPVPLLVLESDWPLPPISPMYTLYGCPRLTRGPQVRCSLNFNAVSVLILYVSCWQMAYASVLDASPSNLRHHHSDCPGNPHIIRIGDYWNCESSKIHSDFVSDFGIWFVILGFVARYDTYSVRVWFSFRPLSLPPFRCSWVLITTTPFNALYLVLFTLYLCPWISLCALFIMYYSTNQSRISCGWMKTANPQDTSFLLSSTHFGWQRRCTTNQCVA
jgi:hypothetical protein